MNPGEMDRQASLWLPEITRNADGSATESMTSYSLIWCKWEPIGGREWLAPGRQTIAEADARVTTRYRSGITPKHKITYNSVEYDVLRVAEIGRQEFLELTVKARVTP
jgi:SPP1 family predicted phage head-tail adaptor